MGTQEANKVLCTKNTINRVKGRLTEWQDIFVNYTAHGVNIYNQQRTPKIQHQNHHPTNQWVDGLKRQLSKEETQMVCKGLKRCLASSASRKCRLNCLEIPAHPSQNGCQQEHSCQWLPAEMRGKKSPPSCWWGVNRCFQRGNQHEGS